MAGEAVVSHLSQRNLRESSVIARVRKKTGVLQGSVAMKGFRGVLPIAWEPGTKTASQHECCSHQDRHCAGTSQLRTELFLHVPPGAQAATRMMALQQIESESLIRTFSAVCGQGGAIPRPFAFVPQHPRQVCRSAPGSRRLVSIFPASLLATSRLDPCCQPLAQ